MSYAKGGRGKKAPYKTTHCRVPEQCKSVVDELVAHYKSVVDDSEATEALLNSVSSSLNRSHEECLDQNQRTLDNETCGSQYVDVKKAKELAKQISKQKQSARKSIAKLLTALYDINVDWKDL